MFPNEKSTGYNLQIRINEAIEGFVKDDETKQFVVKTDKDYFSIDRGYFVESLCALGTPHAEKFADYRYTRPCALTGPMLTSVLRGATLVLENTCKSAGEIGDDGFVYEHDKYDIKVLDVQFTKDNLKLMDDLYRSAAAGC